MAKKKSEATVAAAVSAAMPAVPGGGATSAAPAAPTTPAAEAKAEVLRQPAEVKYADELAYLASVDTTARPFTWRLSPRMVRTFVLGSRPADKLERMIP